MEKTTSRTTTSDLPWRADAPRRRSRAGTHAASTPAPGCRRVVYAPEAVGAHAETEVDFVRRRTVGRALAGQLRLSLGLEDVVASQDRWLRAPYLPGDAILAPLAKSRRRPGAGDIFYLRPSTSFVLFGRVIKTDANPNAAPLWVEGEGRRPYLPHGPANSNLIYIYSTRSALPSPIPVLSRNELLLFPILTNSSGWTQGWFETIETRSLSADDVLDTHRFFAGPGPPGHYFDEYGNIVAEPGPSEPFGMCGGRPVGMYGLSPAGMIGLQVRDALAGRAPLIGRRSERQTRPRA